MQVGFAAIARRDEVELQVFGQARPGRQALVTSAVEGEIRVVLMGRLYYRDELRRRLRQGSDAPSPADDAALALATYHAFGRDGIERLEGDFALVVWDAQERRLLACREAMGGYPIYWLQHDDTIALATGLRPLVELLPQRSLNVDFLGEVQMLPNVEIDSCEATVFEGIHRLVPGWSLEANLARGTVERHQFWKWEERIVPPDSDQPAEIAERYGELLRQAVRERLRDTTAAHLSGGMDSTSVALLAAAELAGKGRSLHALSLVYRDHANLAGETPYLEGALNRPGIVPHRILADDILDYDLFHNMPLHDEPISGLYRYGLQAALLRAADKAGADTVFTGLGADEALAMEPYYIADLFRRGRLWSAWSEAGRWARGQNANIWWILRRYGLGPLLPVWAQAGLGALLSGGYASWKLQNAWTLCPWILGDFARRGRLRSKALAHVRRMFRAHGGVALSEALATPHYFCGDGVRYTLSAPLGIVDVHPFRDLRVFSYGLGIRAHVRPEPGVQKPILAEAMRDVLPANIRQRRIKSHFNSVYYEGLARNRPHLEQMIRASSVEEMGLFDKKCLLRCLEDASLCISSPHGAIGLDNTLSIVKWLELLPQWLAQRPVPSLVIRAARCESLCTC